MSAAMANQAHAAPQPTRSVARAAWPRRSFPGTEARDWQPPRKVSVARRIRHRWSDLFGLVLDLERYPAFVPHCGAVKVYSRAEEGGRTVIVSRMTVGVGGFEMSYVNRTSADAETRRIEVTATDGPLRRLTVLWTFEADGEDWTRVGFSVDYAFNSAILSALASRAFDAMFGEILTAFERRADRLCGRASHTHRNAAAV
jgi:coenzyme Q-binding protein COQ10